MTDTNYEKAYKEALERAQGAADSGMVSQNFVDDIFQLAESEDERMINELKGFLDCFGADYFGTGQWQRFHTWLEKQRESLHISETCKENANSFTDEDEKIRNLLRRIVITANNGDLQILGDNDTKKCLAYLEKQKDKQNLIEKSLDSYMTDPDGYLKDWSNAYDKGFEAAKELFIAQPEKYGLQKQKEQNVVPSRETILGIWELGNLWKENPEERNGLTQLQYIQKYWFEKCDYQKEQKPAEWSEEDEKTRNSIIEAIHNLWPYEHRDKCIQWLKSLPERFNLSSKQEQPDVDFEKAYKFYIKSRKDDLTGNAVTVNMKDLSRHFYELGLNARK